MSAKKGTKLLCSSCYKEIVNKEALSCFNCKQTYDLPCAKIYLKQFLEMTTKNKNIWKCGKCTANDSKRVTNLEANTMCDAEISSIVITDDMIDNVTYRTKTGRSLSQENLSNDQWTNNSDTLNSTLNKNESYNSLPNFTESIEMAELREENITLSTQLSSAHEEITNLNIEINNLKKQMEEKERKLNIYKTLLHAETLHTSPGKQTPNKIKSMQTKNSNNLLSEISKQKINKNEAKKLHTAKQNARHYDKTSVGNSMSQKPNITEDVSYETKNYRTIYIYGGTQCVGLAGKIMNSRINTQYNKYSVTSFIKPYANTQEIIQTSKLNTYTKNDKIILSLGENDTNPFEVMIGLINLAQSVNNCTIIVMSVQNNPYLNTDKLNHTLKHISTNLPNCKFLDFMSENNEQMFQKNKIQKINLLIDMLDYENTYLKPNSNKIVIKYNMKNPEITDIPRKGTIPYYFSRINNKVKNEIKETKQNRNSILNYFPIIKNKYNDNLNKKLMSRDKDFFR